MSRFASFVAMALIATSASAQTPDASTPPLPASVQAAAPSTVQPPAPAVPAGETPYPPPPAFPAGETQLRNLVIPGLKLHAALGQGVTIETDDGTYSLNIRARFQVRDTALDTDSLDGGKEVGTWTNQANIKTFRLILDGHLLSKNIDYFVQLAEGGSDSVAITSQTPSPIYDAFLDLTWLRDLNIRVGQFFVPFDRARTIREYALQFVDRQQVVNELALNRGLGIRFSSDDLFGTGGRLGYAAGAFYNDGINNFTNTVPGLLYVGRVTVKPWGLFDDDIEGDLTRLSRPRLALGGAVAWNQHTSLNQSTYGTLLTPSSTTSFSSSDVLTSTSTTFGSPGTLNYLHADVDLVFKLAGFSFLGEFLYRQADDFLPETTTTTTQSLKPTEAGIAAASVKSATTNAARNGRGYLVQGGYMIDDYFEVVGRFDQLLAVGNTDPTLVKLAATQGREGGGGLNLYLNHHQLKVQADYFHYWGPTPDLGKDQVRLQLDVSI